MNVYKAIAAVQTALAKQGIAKERTNTQPGQNYKFRGIDDVYAALAPLLSEHGLLVLPRCLSRASTERASAAGKALFSVTVDMEYDLVAAEDGSKHTIRVQGEAMDSGDKATNKAMSAAYKYAAFQTFCIPCEGDDADEQTHEVQGRPKDAKEPSKPATRQPTSSGDLWQGENKNGRPFISTGNTPPKGWFDRAKTNRADAIEEIGGKNFGVEKHPESGIWHIVRFVDPPLREPGDELPGTF